MLKVQIMLFSTVGASLNAFLAPLVRKQWHKSLSRRCFAACHTLSHRCSQSMANPQGPHPYPLWQLWKLKDQQRTFGSRGTGVSDASAFGKGCSSKAKCFSIVLSLLRWNCPNLGQSWGKISKLSPCASLSTQSCVHTNGIRSETGAEVVLRFILCG